MQGFPCCQIWKLEIKCYLAVNAETGGPGIGNSPLCLFKKKGYIYGKINKLLKE